MPDEILQNRITVHPNRAEKYPSIFSRQMEAIKILYYPSNILNKFAQFWRLF